MFLSKKQKGFWGLLLMACLLAGATFVQQQNQHQGPQEAWQHGAFMEIFVRSYKDSNGDGIGDLKGLTQSLDHLKDLGIKGIWLMPITASADRDHGYATRDFRNIEPDYGTMADFDELIKEAHKRGIGVIMDYVLNHSAFQHSFFEAALINPQSPYRQWYEWRNEKPVGWEIWGRDPWVTTAHGSYLATFGAPMPDFNMRNPEVVKYHEDNLKFWLDRGIDGFRLDATPHLIENNAKDWNDQPESRQLTHHFTRLIKSYPNKYVVCEATAEPKVYAREDICGGAFAFGLENQISKAAKGEVEAIQKVAQYYTQAPHTLASFASNHDQFAGKRLWDQVNGNETHYKLAAATYLLLPGTPFIYYGEEIGMAGAKGLTDDPFIRGPYSWQPNEKTAGFSSAQPYRAVSGNVSTHHAQGQKTSDNSFWSFYRDMLKLRNTRISLSKGSYEAVQTQGQVWAYQRKSGQEHSAVVINYGTQLAALQLEGIASNATLRPIYPGNGLSNQKGAQITVPAQSVYVFAVEK
jgi:alpha-amylase